MFFPAPIGANPLGASSTPERLRQTLSRMFGVGAYPPAEDETSAHQGELGAYATVASVGAQSIERAIAQAFVTSATELLEDWEREVYLPNDAARTVEERQKRLAAHERANAGAGYSNVLTALRTVAAVVTDIRHCTRQGVLDEKLTDDLAFQVAALIGSADFDSPAVRRAVARLLGRLLPARNYGQSGIPEAEAALIVNDGAQWASASYQVDRDSLRNTGGPVTAGVHAPSRVRNYGRLSKLRSADLNAIQDAILLAAANASAPLQNTDPGADTIALAIQSLNGTTYELDTSVDWRDRLLLVEGRLSTSDIRPGAATDTALNTATHVQSLVYTGAGGASYDATLMDANLKLRCNAADGRLQLVNSTGSTQYLVLVITGTQDLGKR